MTNNKPEQKLSFTEMCNLAISKPRPSRKPKVAKGKMFDMTYYDYERRVSAGIITVDGFPKSFGCKILY